MFRATRLGRALAGAFVAAAATAGSGALGQQAVRVPTGPNPLAGNAEAIHQGRNIFRGRCAVCHGIDAKGYRGSDLTTGEWVHGGSDAKLFTTISGGVPGTEMPGNVNMSPEEVWMVVAYLRTLVDAGTPSPARGDANRGERLFWAKGATNCGQCHMIGGRGGRLGPNLSRIGAARSASALAREIRNPKEVIPVGYETITVVPRDNRRIRGVRKNEDTFSVQLMTASEEILTFLKRDLVEVVPDEQSLMPAYGPERVSDAELDDLVRYLKTLTGPPPSIPK
jgi:putative heme-binding domain-containing protein